MKNECQHFEYCNNTQHLLRTISSNDTGDLNHHVIDAVATKQISEVTRKGDLADGTCAAETVLVLTFPEFRDVHAT